MEYEDSRLTSQPKVLLFDLGGVLLRLNTPSNTFGLRISEEAFLQQWIHSPAVRDFERGTIDAEGFSVKIAAEFELPFAATEFLDRFAAWPDQLFDGVPELLGSIPKEYSTALLSNTNALHWQGSAAAELLTNRLDRVFLSYVTGLLKPDEDAFDHARSEFACEPAEIAFFDDNLANIEAAIAYGYNAYLTRGADELREKLAELEVIT